MATSATTTTDDSERRQGAEPTELPGDLRHSGSLPRYLWLAPPDEQWSTIYLAWVNGDNPHEVWDDE